MGEVKLPLLHVKAPVMATRYQIYSKYRNSRLVNFNRWSEAAEVKKLTDFLVTKIGRRKLSGYKINMRMLLMDLYHSYMTDKDQYVAYFMAKYRYTFKPNAAKGVTENRYNRNPHISYDYFMGCVECLEQLGYIENKPGGHFSDEQGGSYGFMSRMKANESLADLWHEYKVDPEMITVYKLEEVIILRGPEVEEHYVYKGIKKTRKVKREIPDYPDNIKTVRMRKIVEQYNAFLERTHIDVDVDCMSQKDKDAILDRLLHARDTTKYSIDLSSKRVYRVFNNGSFKEGGRFYGAWWIGCPSIIRKYITINGEPTIELDYSAIHINLLYALKGVNYASLNTDAYELKPDDPDRDLNKLILLTAYNAPSPTATAKAVFKSTRDDGTKHIFNLSKHKQVTDKLDRLKEKHPLVADMIAHDKGRMLQYHDSQVMERLIESMTALNIPILTVHDSIICQSKFKDFVDERMKAIYIIYINEVFKSNHPYKPIYQNASQLIRHISKRYSHFTSKPMLPYNSILNKNPPYKGRIKKVPTPIIKVKITTKMTMCSQICNHSDRLKRIKAGKRIFLGKIKIQYIVVDHVISLDIQQR